MKLRPSIRTALSLCLSAHFAVAQPAVKVDTDTVPLTHGLDAESLGTHLYFAIDRYESARDAYEKRGPTALIEEMPELSKEDSDFLRTRVGSLKPLPNVSVENGNTLSAPEGVKAEVLSLRNGVTLKVKGQTVSLPIGGSMRTAFEEMQKALGIKVARGLPLVREAWAADTTVVALSIVAVLASAFLAGKSYSNYQDEKQSRENELLAEDASEEQLTQYRQRHGLSADGSRRFGMWSAPGRAASRFWSSATTKDKVESANFYGTGSWGASIVSALRKLGPSSRMMTQPPADLLQQCSGFAGLSEADKHKVWVAFFDALSMAESGHNPNVRYAESFGVTSRGMLQISWASARGHGGTCAGATAINLHSPEFNLGCGVKIMENQLRRRGTLFPDSYYYWSVLSPGKNTTGFKRFSARLNFLKAIPERWPAGCAK
ncbi:MAG TPA: hypothetical protein VM901_03800 [Bdellovibrionota bacterium]|nr:hypothetical protein [Bdellovibrionota bacterium]